MQLLAAAASTGSACRAGDGADAGSRHGAVRLSLGRFMTEAEIDSATAALIGVWQSLAA